MTANKINGSFLKNGKIIKEFSFSKLIKLARAKFDAQIDAIQLGAQLLKAKNMQDLPRMLKKADHRKWRLFFIKQAKLLSKEIFE